MSVFASLRNKKVKLQQSVETNEIKQSINEAYWWFANIDIFSTNTSKKGFLEGLISLHESSSVYLIPLTKKEELYENKRCMSDSSKIKSLTFFNVTKNKKMAKYTDTSIGITSSNSKVYLKIKDKTVFNDFELFFKDNNKNDRIQIQVKINDEIEEFVIMEIVYFADKLIKLTTDSEYFTNYKGSMFLDEFPEEAYLENYKRQHFFTLEMFSKIYCLNISPEKHREVYTFTINETPPLFLISKRFQSHFLLTFEDIPNCFINFKVHRKGKIAAKTPYPVQHFIDIVIKEGYRPINGFLDVSYICSSKLLERFGKLATHRFNFKDFSSSVIKNTNSFRIKKEGPQSLYENKLKIQANKTILKECRDQVKGSLLMYFKEYNKLDEANRVILDTMNQKIDKDRLAITFDVKQFSSSENEEFDELLYKIESSFDGIIFFKILEPKLEEIYFIMFINFDKICIISTNAIKNIPLQWRQVIKDYEPEP